MEIIPQCAGHPLSVRIRQGCLQSSSLLCGLRCFFTLPFLPFVPLTGRTPRVPFKNIIALFWLKYFNNYKQNALSLFDFSFKSWIKYIDFVLLFLSWTSLQFIFEGSRCAQGRDLTLTIISFHFKDLSENFEATIF